jgi:hypothetical protein
MEYSKSEFLKVVQAPLSQLAIIRDELPEGHVMRYYADVLISYLSGNIPQLIFLADQLTEWHDPLLRTLVQTRLAIREKTVTKEIVQRLQVLSIHDPLWQGEALIIAGFASETIGEYQTAKRLYFESHRSFESIGAKMKSLKALHNYISASSKIETERAYFAEFHLIYRKAKAVRDSDVAGTALTNLGREFQKMGALRSALKYSCRAILFLQKTSGTYQHHMALLNRCHVLCDMGRYHDALEDFDIIKNSPHAEVKAGVKALEEVITKAKIDNCSRIDNHPTWLERLAEERPSEVMTDLEDRMIALLSSKPRDKYMLIEDLYGDRIAIDAAENRLKNLLNRLRKKMPGKILFDNGFYKIADGVELKIS